MPWLVAILAIATGVPRVQAQQASLIACGETRVRQLGPGPDEMTFHAQAGEVVSITAAPLLPLPEFRPRWRIHDVAGRRVPLSTGSHKCIGRCETAPLPAGGTFAIRVSDSGVGVGAYVLSLEATSASANGAPNGPPSPACARTVEGAPDGTRALVLGQSASGTIDRPGDTDTFTTLAVPGTFLLVELTRTGGQDAFAPVWDAFDLLGRKIARGRAGEPASLAVQGVVTILVADERAAATGTYTLAIRPTERPPTTTIAATTSTTSTSAGAATSLTPTTAESSSTTSPDGTTTTATLPGPTTTTLPPIYDVSATLAEPAIGPHAMLGAVLAAGDGRLVVGIAGQDVSRPDGTLARRAGAVLVVDVAGPVGSPTFGQVLRRIYRGPEAGTADEFGAAVAVEGVDVLVGAPGAKSAFLFSRPTGDGKEPPTLRIVPPVDAGVDGFGRAVALAGDLVVVGAPLGGGGAGSAYVFERATGVPHAVLAAPAPVGGAGLGASLAAAGELVLVGAPGTDAVPGRAFLFDAGSGALLQTFESDTPAAGDAFGAAVAFAGDDVVIGAPGADGGRGRVERFAAGGGSPERTYVSPDPAAGERFGAAVAVEDDLLAVGAPRMVRDDAEVGAVYVFDVGSGDLEDAIEKPMPEASDAFGSAVAVEEGRVFAGAPGDDAGTTDGGTTFVFEDGDMVAALRERLTRNGFGESVAVAGGAFWAAAPDGAGGPGYVARVDPVTGLVEEAVFSPQAASTARFGGSLAVLGATLVVGAPESDVGGLARAGTVYLYDGAGTPLAIANPEPHAGDQFGFAVGVVDGDVLASAPFVGENDVGLVYRLDAAGDAIRTYGKSTPIGADFFGADVAGNDGQVLVGAPLDAGGGATTGAVYLFDADAATIVHAIPNPNGANELFGAAVALGQWIVVGAPLADDGRAVGGTVWMFDRATGSLIRKLENPSPGSFDSFGASLALRDDQLVVGAPRADDTAVDAGLVYVFEGPTGRLLQTFRSPPQGIFDNFGFSVAAGDAGVLVGSPGPGRVYVFDAITSPAGVARAVARGVAPPAPQCGNGLVEEPEECDDGNDVDADDCRGDCTRGPCCTLDAISTRCDDGNPCTADFHDDVVGCRYEPTGDCCVVDADCGQDGQCRQCVGCFLFPWDCCPQGSQCIATNPACGGETCLDKAYCECFGGLACDGETIPDALAAPFGAACNIIQGEATVAPDGTPVTKDELVAVRQKTKSARLALKKAVRAARALSRRGEIRPACRKKVAKDVRLVRSAIPRGKKLRRCLGAES